MKSKKATYVFLFCSLFLAILGLNNCGPKEDTRPTYPIDQTTIDYCIFNEGSWWVYEEEDSGLKDTVL